MENNLSFEKLPNAVFELQQKLNTIEDLLRNLPNQAGDDKPLTIEEAADLLKLSKQTIYKYVREKEIPFSKKGKRLYFSKAEILQWIKEGRRKTLNEIKAEAHTYVKRRGRQHGK